MTAMVPLLSARRTFDALVRERAAVIRLEAAQQTGFVRAPGVTMPSSARRDWRDQQARQQRYESLVCESLADLWLEGVPQVRERARRREITPES
jgi:hypothetical protein